MREFTVGDLQRELTGIDPSKPLHFSGGLTFLRLRIRDDVLLEFGEPEAMLAESFRGKYPEVQVAFCHSIPMGDDLVEESSIPIIEA
jgi:hypothetical protein